MGLIALCVLLAFAGTSHAGNTYIEDFATATYKDTLNTTADWDTVAAELRMQPFVPAEVGSLDTAGSAKDVAISGGIAVVADGVAGVHVINVYTPTPILIGSYNTTGSALGVDVAGNIAYVAGQTAGLQIIDFTNSSSPTLLSTYDTPDWASAVAVAGNLACVADGLSGLQIIDVTDPSTPLLAGTYSTTYAIGVVVAGSRAFVVDFYDGLKIVDISDPSSPTLIGSYNTGGNARAVALHGNLALVTTSSAGLFVLDISDPASPSLIGQDSHGGTGITVDGDRAYVSDGDLHIIDITDPVNPTLKITWTSPTDILHAVVAGEHAFLAGDTGGLRVVQVRETLEPPTLAGSIPDSGDDIFVSGNFAYFTGPTLRIYDISDPANSVFVGQYAPPPGEFLNWMYGVAVVGDLAYVAAEYPPGLQIVDVGDPSNPTLVGEYSTGPNNFGVYITVDGATAYLTKYPGFDIVDVSDPSNPTLLGTYDTGDFYGESAVKGDILYTTRHVTYDGELLAFDVSNPASPTVIGSAPVPARGGVTLWGDIAFITRSSEGVYAVDVSIPTDPSPMYSIYGGPARQTAVSGNRLFVTGDDGLLVFETTIGITPITSYPTISAAHRLTVSGNLALASSGGNALALRVFQDDVDPSAHTGASLAVDADPREIYSVHLASTQTAGVSWEVSADDGTNWQEIALDTWEALTVPGSDLRWRSTHAWAEPGLNPTVTDLQIDWLVETPTIESISDIGNDQGRRVRVSWVRSGHDLVGDATQAVEYAVYRKIDPDLGGSVQMKELNGLSAAARGHAATMQAAGWDFVASVPVLAEDNYSVVVPTLQDSTQSQGQYWTTFRVTAYSATPGVFWDSPPDSGYSLDNLAPSAPANLVVSYNNGGGNALSWDECADDDFDHFRVYRSTDPNSIPSPDALAHTTTSTSWLDTGDNGSGAFYKVTAVDAAGNESEAAAAGTVTSAGISPAPATYALYPNVPNPFNPVTTIRYDVPAGGEVSLRIYDVSGRLVTTLVSGVQTAGAKSVTWNGRDSNGRAVASGVYFYRLSAVSYNKTHKMVLMK
jgi:hypothetical protein